MKDLYATSKIKVTQHLETNVQIELIHLSPEQFLSNVSKFLLQCKIHFWKQQSHDKVS